MARKLNVKGYEEFCQVTATLEKDPKQKVIVYFTGERNENGVSWCPDCVNGKLQNLSKDDRYLLMWFCIVIVVVVV